ncbi:hypothetical protein PENSPDRAFT_639113 [Peniophora sp. CONT]|nr:hypothetical protein PENSPDRAFT_639113 [Peniophora sp. CONT]
MTSVYGAQQQDVVPGEQYRYALANFRIAHEKVEEQRTQLETQERQVAALRARVAQLEGSSTGPPPPTRQGGSTVDDFTIKTSASKLERLLNRWAADTVRAASPADLDAMYNAALEDMGLDPAGEFTAPGRPAVVQNLLRHALAEVMSEGILNLLVVTSSTEANIELSRIHAILFERDPTVAAVWRRQTMQAAVEAVAPTMTQAMFEEHFTSLTAALPPAQLQAALGILDQAIAFSRMLHGAAGDAFYRSFMLDPHGGLSPQQVELVKRCMRTEKGEQCVIGTVLFPGLVKVIKEGAETNITRRAQVICNCALILSAGTGVMSPPSLPSTPSIG